MQASDYNPLLSTVQADPYPYYTALREHSPVYFNEQLGWYIVSRYEDVVAITKNPAVFSSARAIVQPERLDEAEKVAPISVRSFRRGVLIGEDPPTHTKTRNLVTRAFTPKRIAEMEPRIRQIARELISQLPRSGEFDLIKDVAEPLPMIVIAEMLGVEPERRHDFKRWSDDAIAISFALVKGAELTGLEHSSREMADYMARALEARRQQPQEDLIQALLDNGVREGLISVEDASAFCRLLLVAGNETTTNLLGNGMRALLSHPDQLERLTREPELIPNAVEEMLRFDSAAQALFRKTTQEVEVSGTRIPAGASVLLLFGSANRDPRKFQDPDRFDVTRNVAGQVAFGHGIHFCLGAPLARLEAKVTLEELLTPDRKLSLVPGQRLENVSHFTLRGLKSLRLRTEPARSTHASA
ncbi:putative cytochrome P450 hydroxylase [Cystobacter fuscus DSM 2262]|uniref:Cytochrome P450 hydroxylase n=1 Tax=Cystobacter fuscus (strain ATCC 25194 / DSM 2262 / NBRC 100088 / M29) TaxID=1242864 RepID=S9QZ77_CYSF2|nr:cytochrome P450 [Cystobacter fuscus]EPX61978.1 putative cytochrome P450 hydroxylase [Cystobacter fuscus DSM 2262]